MATTTTDTIPVGPSMSLLDGIYAGNSLTGKPHTLDLAFRNLLVVGEPGGGKSGLLNNIVGQCSLCFDTRLVLIDGKQVELGLWEEVADAFVGNKVDKAILTLLKLQRMMDNRYDYLHFHKRRKFDPAIDGEPFYVVVIDELAYFSATVGDKQTQELFVALVRDLVSRGRAAGIVMVAATQRPNVEIIPTSLRDLFAYRAVFRCSTPNSSDLGLGFGWAAAGYSATDIAPEEQGHYLLLAEGGVPVRLKSPFLTDRHIIDLAAYAAQIRRAAAVSADSEHLHPPFRHTEVEDPRGNGVVFAATA